MWVWLLIKLEMHHFASFSSAKNVLVKFYFVNYIFIGWRSRCLSAHESHGKRQSAEKPGVYHRHSTTRLTWDQGVFSFHFVKNIPAGKAKRKAGLPKNKSLPLGPFIRGKIRRVLHTTRTVPFTIYTSLSYLRREQLVSMVRVLFLLLGMHH